MRSVLKKVACLAFLATPLILSAPLHAQQASGTLTPPASTNPSPPQDGQDFQGGEERGERQQFREEREKIRAEHEELEAEHDRLKAQCMDTKGQERSACHDQMEALHEKMEALHERMHILREQIKADHMNSRREWKEHQAMRDQHPAGQPPSPTPAPAPAPIQPATP